MTCLCHRPFTLPDPWILFGCPCGEVWQKGWIQGDPVWRNRIGVTAQAVPQKKKEDYTRAGESVS
jgi:hypothetical protein